MILTNTEAADIILEATQRLERVFIKDASEWWNKLGGFMCEYPVFLKCYLDARWDALNRLN